MPDPHAPNRTTASLLHRAAETSLNSARIIARSIELIARSLTIAQAVARAGSVQVETRRTGSQPAGRVAKPRFARHIARVDPLPLTPPRLLEVAEEFRALARSAPTPECRAAFEDLVFRYTALAAGFDNAQVASRRLH